MTLDNVYVLEIPDLQQVLSRDDIGVWELFLLTAEKRYEKIRFEVSNDGGCYTFKNVETCNGLLATVQINFDKNIVVFNKTGAPTKEFEEFLLDLFSQLFVRVETNRIQFLTSARKSKVKKIKSRK